MTIGIREGREADIRGIARVHVQGWRESYKDFLALRGFCSHFVLDNAANLGYIVSSDLLL